MSYIPAFFSGLFPSPTGSLYAAVVAWKRPTGGISVCLSSTAQSSTREIGFFEELSPVTVTWGNSDDLVVFAQANHCKALTQSGEVISIAVDEPPVRALAFDSASRLWGLSGYRLWVCEPGQFSPSLENDNVLSFAAATTTIAVLKRKQELVLAARQGSCWETMAWPLRSTMDPKVNLSRDGAYLFVSSEQPCAPNRSLFELCRVNLQSGSCSLPLSQVVAAGIGWRGVPWVPWHSGTVVALAELGDCAQLHAVNPDSHKFTGIGPQDVEVTSFSASVAADTIAIVGVGLESLNNGLRESLFVLQRPLSSSAVLRVLEQGNYLMPQWNNSGSKLFYVASTSCFEQEVRCIGL